MVCRGLGQRTGSICTVSHWLRSSRGCPSAKYSGTSCTEEPWIVGHHIILAHARTCQLYRNVFKTAQEGKIGITLNGDWAEPWDESPESKLGGKHGHELTKDVLAAQTKMDFAVGWFADPIYLGRYPQSMIDRLGDRLPSFTDSELELVTGSSEVSQVWPYSVIVLTSVLWL